MIHYRAINLRNEIISFDRLTKMRLRGRSKRVASEKDSISGFKGNYPDKKFCSVKIHNIWMA